MNNQTFKIGDEVKVRNDIAIDWRLATVTQLKPLRAQVGGNIENQEWSYVRRVNKDTNDELGNKIMNKLSSETSTDSMLVDTEENKHIEVDQELILELCDRVVDIFLQESVLLELRTAPDERFVLLGDIHGQYYDMMKILEKLSQHQQENDPEKSDCYVFLGDYVDRGDYSLEVILWLLSWKILSPQRMYMLRGNHETRSINKKYGFFKEIVEMYGDDDGKIIYEAINNVFDFMPIAATLNQKYFCVHGGLSPKLEDTNTLRNLEFPLVNPRIGGLINDLLWSDPSQKKNVLFFDQNRSRGPIFGKQAVVEFLLKSELKGIIRAHEVANDGFWTTCDDLVLTLFSAPYYKKVLTNKAAALIVEPAKRTLIQFTKNENDGSIAISHVITETGTGPTVEDLQAMLVSNTDNEDNIPGDNSNIKFTVGDRFRVKQRVKTFPKSKTEGKMEYLEPGKNVFLITQIHLGHILFKGRNGEERFIKNKSLYQIEKIRNQAKDKYETVNISLNDHTNHSWGLTIYFGPKGDWYVTNVDEKSQAACLGIKKGWRCLSWKNNSITPYNANALKKDFMKGNAGMVTFRKSKDEYNTDTLSKPSEGGRRSTLFL